MRETFVLTPERLLRLYTRMPVPGERLGALVGNAFKLSPASRERCDHLLPLFTPERWRHVTLWDLYQTHYRWAGAERWRQLVAPLLPDQMTEAGAALRAADPPLRWGMVEAACDSSRRLAASHGPAALTLARAAVAAAGTVPTNILGERCQQELLALARATVANAHRVLDQLRPARTAMTRAQKHLERAHPPLLGLTPAVLGLRVSLEYWNRDFPHACATVAEALQFDSEPPLRGRLLINQARILIDLKRSADALESLQEAIPLIHRDDEPRLWCCAVQNRLLVLSELGRLDEAESELRKVRAVMLADSGPLDELKIRWVEARIAAGHGDSAAAEDLYRQVHGGFLTHGLPFRAAVVTLEWCRLLLAEGRLEEVKQRAMATLAEFHRQQVEPEIISALALVEQAVLGQRLTEQILVRARNLLDRHTCSRKTG